MQATRVLSMARKIWPVQAQPPVAHSRRHEIMLAFRPSPEIPGFNLHYLAAARRWIKNKNSGQQQQQVDIGHIRIGRPLTDEEIEEAEERLKKLPKSLKNDMEVLWKDTSKEKKKGGLWVREEIKRSNFGGSIKIVDYWATAIRLSKQFLVDGPNNLMKIMEEGGFLQPNKDHDVEEFSSYMEKRLGRRIYPTFQYNKELKSNTLEGVYVLFDRKTDEVLDHPNQIFPGKFRVGGQGCSKGGSSFGRGAVGSSEGGSFESGGATDGSSSS